jgi:hypothetical protein
MEPTKNEILRIVKLLKENSTSRLEWIKTKGAGMSEIAKKVQTDYIENVLLLLTLFENWQHSPHGRIKPEALKISFPDLCIALSHAQARGVIKRFTLDQYTVKIETEDSDQITTIIDIPLEISPLDFARLITDLKYLSNIKQTSNLNP